MFKRNLFQVLHTSFFPTYAFFKIENSPATFFFFFSSPSSSPFFWVMSKYPAPNTALIGLVTSFKASLYFCVVKYNGSLFERILSNVYSVPMHSRNTRMCSTIFTYVRTYFQYTVLRTGFLKSWRDLIQTKTIQVFIL